MANFFEQINHILKDTEFAGILIIILIISLIVLNIIACICVISAQKSLKQIARNFPSKNPVKEERPTEKSESPTKK